MSKPKNMTPEEEHEWKRKRLEYQRKYEFENKEKIREQQKEWKKKDRLKNPTKYRTAAANLRRNKGICPRKLITYAQKLSTKERMSIYHKITITQCRERCRNWRLKNKERNKQICKTNDAKRSSVRKAMVEKLEDQYISKCLGIPINLAKMHPNLLQAKREQIKILRELKPRTRKNKHNAQEPEQPATSPR